MTTIDKYARIASLALTIMFFSITLTDATGEGNYRNDTNTLPNIFEGTFTEAGYKANIFVNPQVTGIYNNENGFKLDLTINSNGAGEAQNENGFKLDLTPQKSFPEPHDLKITMVITSKTIVGRGYDVTITVKISNQELSYETFHFTINANNTDINTQTITLTSRATTKVIFKWNTAGFTNGYYQIGAKAHPIPGEALTADNTLFDGVVKVVTPGDVNADGVVNMADISGVSAHWSGPPAGPLGYDPNFDVNCDGIINIQEVSIISAYWTGPPKGPLDP